MMLDLWVLPSWSRGFLDTPHALGIVLVEVCEPMLASDIGPGRSSPL